jgi:hypothetical protein
MLEGRLGGHREAIVWPEKPVDVPDGDPSFLVAYMPLEFAGKPRAEREQAARLHFEKYGDKPRQYRNGLGLAVPATDQIEILKRSVRYLVAAEQVKAKAKHLNLTDEQRSQLREREATERAAAESALLKLYGEVWLPRVEGGGLGVDAVAFGGRPPQTTLNARKEAAIHERIMELLTNLQPRVFATVAPSKIVELFKLGEGDPPKLGIKISEIVDGFYSFLGFTRLATRAAVAKGVADGISEKRKSFGYLSGPTPTVGPDGRFQVPVEKVRFGVHISEDEMDLESGFLMLPQAIPQPPPPPAGAASAGVAADPMPGGPVSQPAVLPAGPAQAGKQTTVELSLRCDRNQLFAAWGAIANLADLAGTVSVQIHAESPAGFDKGKLENGVMEPLREGNLVE